MKKVLVLISVVLLCVMGSPLVNAQQKPEPQFKLVQFYMGLLKKGPGWEAAHTGEHAELHQKHVAYVMSLLESGKAMIAGPLTDDLDIHGVPPFRVECADEAKAR